MPHLFPISVLTILSSDIPQPSHVVRAFFHLTHCVHEALFTYSLFGSPSSELPMETPHLLVLLLLFFLLLLVSLPREDSATDILSNITYQGAILLAPQHEGVKGPLDVSFPGLSLATAPLASFPRLAAGIRLCTSLHPAQRRMVRSVTQMCRAPALCEPSGGCELTVSRSHSRESVPS